MSLGLGLTLTEFDGRTFSPALFVLISICEAISNLLGQGKLTEIISINQELIRTNQN